MRRDVAENCRLGFVFVLKANNVMLLFTLESLRVREIMDLTGNIKDKIWPFPVCYFPDELG